MKHIASELRALVTEYTERVSEITESEWSAKPNPAKWSKKEVLGHLIDSALNNQRRFVVTQYAQNQNIVYYQDEWVASQDYQSADTGDLIQLWRLFNLQIARILETMPESVWHNQCDTGKNGMELHSLEWLVADYIPHMRHHFGQIFGLTRT
jgi:hypothetical protein